MDDTRDDTKAAREPLHGRLTPKQQAVMQVHALAQYAALQGNRRVLNADEMVTLTEFYPKTEVRSDEHNLYFFSINGRLGIEKIEGALFAGNLIGIGAESIAKAKELAIAGFEDTVKLIWQSVIMQEVKPSNPWEFAEKDNLKLNPEFKRKAVAAVEDVFKVKVH